MPASAEVCTASVYNEGFGRPLADGRRHSPREMLAAHRTARLGSRIRITVIATGRSIVVPVADRGPYVRGRCVDVTPPVARVLGFFGLARVRVELLSAP